MGKTAIDKNFHILVWISAAVYCAYYGGICILKYMTFAYYDFDLSVHAHSMWRILHGSIFNSILGIPFPGNHMQTILFLIAPVYAVFPHPVTLLVLQTLALGFAVIPLYHLARRIIGPGWAVLVSLLYLTYPALGYLNLFEFHPPAFAVFFLALMLYYYECGAFLKFSTAAFFAMLCQENIPLAVVMMGVLAAVERRALKWIVLPIGGGGVFFAVSMAFMRHFNQETIQYWRLYSHLGSMPAEALRNVFLHPLTVMPLLLAYNKILYVASLFVSVAFVPLAAVHKLIPAAPYLLQHMLSARPQETTIYYHYTAEMIPFIFAALVYGLKNIILRLNIASKRGRFALGTFIPVFFLISILNGPHERVWMHRPAWGFRDDADRRKEAFIQSIPRHAPVVATFEVMTHLVNRNEVYSLHHQYSGVYTLSAKPYRLPDTTEYALIDVNDFLTFKGFYGPRKYRNLRIPFGDKEWHIIDIADTLILLKKDATGARWLFSEIRPQEVQGKKTDIAAGGGIALVGYEFSRGDTPEMLDAVFYWQCRRAVSLDIGMILDIMDSDGHIVMRKIRPIGYMMYPTQSWEESSYHKEYARLYVPVQYQARGYTWFLGFFDYVTGRSIPVDNAVTPMVALEGVDACRK